MNSPLKVLRECLRRARGAGLQSRPLRSSSARRKFPWGTPTEAAAETDRKAPRNPNLESVSLERRSSVPLRITYYIFSFYLYKKVCPKGGWGVRSASGRRCRKATAQNRRQARPTGKPPDTGNPDLYSLEIRRFFSLRITYYIFSFYLYKYSYRYMYSVPKGL